jgi:hypothetical protein
MDRRSPILLVSLAMAGCTVTPAIVAPPPTPDFVGNAANGGIIDLGPAVPKGQPPAGPAHVVKEWVDAYAVLMKKYGKDFTPPVKPGDGVKPLPDGTYSVDLEHLVDNNIAATMERSGISP